jgi:hypothetical protein
MHLAISAISAMLEISRQLKKMPHIPAWFRRLLIQKPPASNATPKIWMRAPRFTQIFWMTLGGEGAALPVLQQPVMICEPETMFLKILLWCWQTFGQWITLPIQPRHTRSELGQDRAGGSPWRLSLGAGFAAIKMGWLVVTFEKPVKEEPKAESTEEPKA